MPNSILILFVLAVALLALLDVVLGQARPGHFGFEGGLERISLVEFLTRPLPIFLFGIGVAMLPARPMTGALLLLGAALLFTAGRRSRCRKSGDCAEAS